MGPKSSTGLHAGCELDSLPSECLLTRLEFQPVDLLPTQSHICVLGGVLAVLDLDELASRPETGELMARPDTDELAFQLNTDELASWPNTNELKARFDTDGTSLVMIVGRHLLTLAGKYVLDITYVHFQYTYLSLETFC